jgi:predicted 2-oxoglutarate/Fe(II)-dependent dioxygenase YbiX
MIRAIANDVFVVPGLVSADECQAWIAHGEALGFVEASVLTRDGRQMRTDIRNNDRVAWNAPELAAKLWPRCRPYLPDPFEGGVPVGLDPSFRFYRYDVGQQFKRHRDGVVHRTPSEFSRFTVLLYLNDDFTGGETVFHDDAIVGGQRREYVVVPRRGDALFFRHDWWHEGKPLFAGRKYVLRTDAFYRFPVS